MRRVLGRRCKNAVNPFEIISVYCASYNALRAANGVSVFLRFDPGEWEVLITISLTFLSDCLNVLLGAEGLFCQGGHTRYTLIVWRPLRLRRLIVSRPLDVFIRLRKPCVVLRDLLLGFWKVDISVSVCWWHIIRILICLVKRAYIRRRETDYLNNK